jgi:hypothetical protein
MTISLATSLGVSTLSPVLKDLYEQSKEKFGNTLAKWNNAKTIQALVTKVSAYERIKTIWQRDKEVKLSSFYYPSKVTFNTGLTKTISGLSDLPTIGSLVIQGTVGQGKSVFLRYLCIQELKNNASGRIPVLIELRKLDEKYDLEAAVFSTLKNLGFEISSDLFEYYAESRKLVILLDGFDELNEKTALKTITQLEAWAIEYPSLQIIITSRPGAEIQKSNHFSIVRLTPLTPADHKPFIAKIGVKGEKLENLILAINDSPLEIRSLLTTPLLLTLLVLVYQVENSIPSELPEFFKLLFVTVFSRHDGTKPAFTRTHKSGLNERKLELLFSSFCFAAKRRQYTPSLTESEFNTAFDDGARFLKDKCPIEGFRHDIVKVACLLQEDGLMLSFVHKSLLDYFSAAFISTRTEKQAKQIYASIRRGTMGWRPTLQFLQHIDRYRYARDFAIPELQRELDYLAAQLEGTATEEELADKIFSDTFPMTEVRFTNYSDGDFVYSGFGPYHDPNLYFADTFIDDSSPTKYHGASYPTETALLEDFPSAQKIENQTFKEFRVLYSTIMTNEDKRSLAQRATNTRDRLKNMLNDFEEIVRYEDANAELLASFDIYENEE